ncbi:hypothetical protein FSP39_021282 [Pinctada imbricata]|uniref:Uncharacterized protein n=1 Tax=Pinctada imbricata TaxID=66713 RepID=A0AA88Y8T8_PINIB|nr:hypothetical protein FSP39_021282 [Pinctada imbricata]
MLKVENVNKTFTLQARTGLAVNAQGETTNATVFTGFAAKDHTNATLQVELSDNRTGFSVKITVGVRLLTVVTTAPTDVQGQTKGLLGNFDDNPDNDFVKPDGTTIHTNSTQREIFNNFGQPWAITEQESLFNYTPGMSAADFQHPNFEPLFVDEVDPEKVANATTQCGGASASQACIFDLLATGDQALADASGQSEEQGDSEQTIASNTAPTISGNTTIYATVNTPVELRYTATDDGTVNVTFLDQPTSNFAYNVTDGEVYATWTPVDSSEAGISDTVASNDPNFLLLPNVNVTQDMKVWRNKRSKWAVSVHQRICNDCSNDTDGCASQPCDVDRTCIDLPPDEHARLDRGYNCSDCAAGYRENDTKCVDIDECDENPSICPQQCDNSEGNYSCSCYSTYRLLGDSCIDIDECAEQTAGCQQNCENTAGNFSCSCVYGYSLNADGKTCTQVLDACAIAGLTCSYACDNSTGNFKCICQNGYQLDSDGSSCVDLNECSQSVCTQECTNSVGSYTCSCYSGYTLSDDGTSCEECTVPNWGPNCANTCICGVGVDSCDPVQGCVCAEGYEGSDCGDDIDECTVNPGICSSDMICENLDGSYECLCYAGYTKVNNSCVDDDECASAATNVCPSESTCENNAGNYTCDCNAGYNQNGIRSCLDIDECTTGAHNCEQLCENVAGSYNCKCEFGFSLNADRVTCTKVSDPCASYGNLTCDYACKLNGTSVSCFCRSGYQLATDGQTCLDIDECSDSTLNLCSDPNTCVNQDGSFTCNCEDGNKLENDGVTCTPCDEFHYGTNCANSCNCGAGAERCDSVSGCVCMTGWTGDKCDADKDECQSSPSVCTGTNTQCLNSPGSYVCSCLTGYSLVGSGPDCADIDECAGVTACSQTCTNTQGSYVCSCASGFRLTGGTTCTDIDECSASSPVCDQDCINTIGSFKCSCKDGFLLNSTTKNTCYAKTECNVGHSCNQTCFINTALQDECLCSSGYNLNADNQTCDNIDECAQGTPCASGTCTDSIPGFICSCDVGKKLAVDGVTCEDCEAWKYGTDCNTNCTCVIANSESCNNTDGTCTCKTGYEGADCGTDIDECTANTYTCPTNSACQNTDGSYVCKCNAGFAYAGGQCVACDSTTYGTNCAGQCTCNLQNTQDCDDVSGACTCKTGWDGTNCTNDIDECTTNNHTCGSNSHCVNTNGSYRCDCDSGWTGTGGSCNTDIDECLIPPPICGDHGNCSNYPGTYNCTCDKGWNGTNCEFGNCFIDRTICTGNTECVQNGTNTTCQCLPGYDATCSVVDVTFQRTSLVITLDITVSNTSLSDNTSDEYAEIYQKIKTSLENYYTSVLGNYLIGVILNSISYGSVIANHQVVTSSSDPAASAIAAAVRAMVDGTANFTYDGSVVNITSVSSNGVVITSSFTACQLFELTRTCASGYECVNDGTNTYCRAIATSDDDNLGLIIGLSVGASVLVIGIIVAIVIYQYKHKTGRYNTKKRVSLSQTLRGRRTASVGSVEFNDTLLKKEGSGISTYKSRCAAWCVQPGSEAELLIFWTDGNFSL